MKLPKIPRRFLPLIVLTLVLLLIMPRTAKFGYDYKKGSPWPYETLIAEFDFPVLKTEDQILEERESAGSVIIPYYRKDLKAVQELSLTAKNATRAILLCGSFPLKMKNAKWSGPALGVLAFQGGTLNVLLWQ